MPKSEKIVPYEVLKERQKNRPPKLRRVGRAKIISLEKFRREKESGKPRNKKREYFLRSLHLPQDASDEEIVLAMVTEWEISEQEAWSTIRRNFIEP